MKDTIVSFQIILNNWPQLISLYFRSYHNSSKVFHDFSLFKYNTNEVYMETAICFKEILRDKSFFYLSGTDIHLHRKMLLIK